MGRKKQNPEESVKRSRILEAASDMFMRMGYKAVGMDALCEAVPVSKRTLYNHFSDKKALFSAVMQQCCQPLFDSLKASLAGCGGPRECLTGFADRYLDLVLDPGAINLYRIAMTEAPQFPELGALFYECGPKRSSEVLAGYLRGLHEGGVLHIPEPELAAHFLLGMLKSRPQMQCMMGMSGGISDADKRLIARYAVQVFLTGHPAA